MSDTLDWNAKTIAEFRANEGRVGGNFEGRSDGPGASPRPQKRTGVRQPDDVPPARHRSGVIYTFDDAVRAVECALALIEQQPSLRPTVHAGRPDRARRLRASGTEENSGHG